MKRDRHLETSCFHDVTVCPIQSARYEGAIRNGGTLCSSLPMDKEGRHPLSTDRTRIPFSIRCFFRSDVSRLRNQTRETARVESMCSFLGWITDVLPSVTIYRGSYCWGNLEILSNQARNRCICFWLIESDKGIYCFEDILQIRWPADCECLSGSNRCSTYTFVIEIYFSCFGRFCEEDVIFFKER